jgi:hypothetical protein
MRHYLLSALTLSLSLSFSSLASHALADNTAAGAAAGAPAAGGDADTVDISSVKDKLKLVTDGKHHYLAFVAGEFMDDFFFYGDGKSFYALRSLGGGSEGTIAFNRIFWEPRVNARYQASFDYKERKYTVQCDKRNTELKVLPADEAKAMIAGAAWHKPRWKRQAYLLARDSTGKYYYVDRMREPEGNKNFRLFAGPKGAIKALKMVNIVSDSEGDIFATKSGELRLVLDKQESTWIQGKSKTKLVQVPIEDNHVLIYTDLGVYTGEKLGTPCDDL